MVKQSATKLSKALNYKKTFRGEFTIGIYNDLVCNFCGHVVDCSRKSSVDSHRKSKKHIEGIAVLEAKRNKDDDYYEAEQSFFDNSEKSIIRTIILAFLSADIPLHKLNNEAIKEMFKLLGAPPISVTASRSQMEKMYVDKFDELIDYFKDKKVFLIVDESEINKLKYFGSKD